MSFRGSFSVCLLISSPIPFPLLYLSTSDRILRPLITHYYSYLPSILQRRDVAVERGARWHFWKRRLTNS